MTFENTKTGAYPQSKATGPVLSEQQVEDFHTKGYLVFPSFLGGDLVKTLMEEVDTWVDTGLRQQSIAQCRSPYPPEVTELDLGQHGWLVSHPPVMAILEQLIGPAFAFHHLHSDRHGASTGSKNWHHDYEQYPQANRSHAMVHLFYYLNGLEGSVGDLVLLPGSHRFVMDKKAFAHFGDSPLPNEEVIEQLPPGSVVMMHSALLHARRAKRSKGEEKYRYFIDCSYCQGGVRWPQVKTYWRGLQARARSLGLDRGQWPELFAERHFYSPFEAMVQFDDINQGSLLERLVPSDIL